MIDQKYEKLVEVMLASVDAVKRTGIKVVSCKDNYAKLLMPLQGNTNHVGTMYAGPLFVLGEVSGGAVFAVAIDYNKYFPIVKGINIRFKRPAMSDITVELEMSPEEADRVQSTVDKDGKADYEMDLVLKDCNEDPVAIVHGVWQARAIPPGMKLPWSD